MDDFTPKLIEAVKKHPVIYARGLNSRRGCGGCNYLEIREAWNKIQKELDIPIEFTTMKDKWKNLKDTYVRYRKKDRSKMTWRWTKHMSFLDDVEKSTDNEVQNITAENKSDENEEINNDDVKEEFRVSDSEVSNDYEFVFENTSYENSVEKLQEPSEKKTQKRKLPEPEPHIDPLILDNNITTVQCDRSDLLFLGYSNSFKRLSHIKQIIVKYKISKILMEAEMSEIKQ